MIAKHSKLVSNWNPALSNNQKGHLKQGRLAKRCEDDLNTYLQPTRVLRVNNDFTSDMTWLTTAADSSEWDAMESDFIGS